MANDKKWSLATPEWHVDEAQRLVEKAEHPDTLAPTLRAHYVAVAQIHATLAAAKMTDRLDSTLLEMFREYRTSGVQVNVNR